LCLAVVSFTGRENPSHRFVCLSVCVFCLQVAWVAWWLGIWLPKGRRSLYYWNFSFSSSPPNKYSGLISFRIDWFDLLAVQGILKSLLQHHNSKASVLWHPDFFMVQLSHPYMTTRKNIALTRWIFVSKVTSLLFNMLSRLFIAFIPRNKCLLIS